MIIDIHIIDRHTAVISYFSRPSIRLTCDEDITVFLRWFLDKGTTLQYSEYKSAVELDGDTQEISCLIAN